MPARIRASRFFDVPYSLYDIVLQMRGAIDPDTGQIVCHFYSLGALVIETPRGGVPAVVVEGCLIVTYGPDNVRDLLEAGEAVEVESITVRQGRLVIGDVEIDHYWGLAALVYAREAGQARFYKLRLAVEDGEPAPIAGILAEQTDSGPVLMLVPRTCEYVEEQEQLPTHM